MWGRGESCSRLRSSCVAPVWSSRGHSDSPITRSADERTWGQRSHTHPAEPTVPVYAATALTAATQCTCGAEAVPPLGVFSMRIKLEGDSEGAICASATCSTSLVVMCGVTMRLRNVCRGNQTSERNHFANFYWRAFIQCSYRYVEMNFMCGDIYFLLLCTRCRYVCLGEAKECSV